MAYQEPPEDNYTETPLAQDSTGTQIELSRDNSDLDTLILPHGIYSFHSGTENSGNRIKITVWEFDEDPTKVSNNPIIEMSGDDIIKVVNLLPLWDDENYSLGIYYFGSELKRWKDVLGNRMYNDTTESKTLAVHSGT